MSELLLAAARSSLPGAFKWFSMRIGAGLHGAQGIETRVP